MSASPPPEIPTAAASRRRPSRKATFLVLQVLVAAAGVGFLYQGVTEFLAAAGGDPTPLFVSGVLVLVAATLFYTAFILRSRRSTPFFATLVANLFGLLVLAALWTRDLSRLPEIVLAIAVVVALALMRGRFQLRPGDFVKENRLPPEILAKVATKVRGVRCRECGDDDVWITSDKELVCKNCGSTAA
jgi:hypothetical protein